MVEAGKRYTAQMIRANPGSILTVVVTDVKDNMVHYELVRSTETGALEDVMFEAFFTPVE